MLPLVSALLPLGVVSPPSTLELNGFLIYQDNCVVAKRYGRPVKQGSSGSGWTRRVFILDRARHGYTVFESSPMAPTSIVSIQVSGEAGTPMAPFYGVRLGDSRSAVDRRFGSPSRTGRRRGTGETIALYKDRNYTLEFSASGRLSSIRIVELYGFPKGTATPPDLAGLRRALKGGDVARTLGLLMPDAIIYGLDRKAIRFTLPAHPELADPRSPIHRILFSGPGSVASALARADAPTLTTRRWGKGFAHPVMSFSRGLRGIVWKAFAGSWRVWEIRL